MEALTDRKAARHHAATRLGLFPVVDANLSMQRSGDTTGSVHRNMSALPRLLVRHVPGTPAGLLVVSTLPSTSSPAFISMFHLNGSEKRTQSKMALKALFQLGAAGCSLVALQTPSLSLRHPSCIIAADIVK